FASSQSEPDRQAVGIDHCVNLTGQAISRPSHGLPSIASDAGTVLMNANNGRVDHLHGRVMPSCQCIHDPTPNACSTPANKAVVASGVGTERFGQIAPRCPGSQDPEDAVKD